MERGLHALKSQLGVVPKGYRSPAGETSENLIRLLDKHGFVYNSSLLDDINPYRHVMPDGRPGPIELPWHWSLDDAPYALFSIKGPRPIFPNSHLKEIFQAEFRRSIAGAASTTWSCTRRSAAGRAASRCCGR